MVNTSIILPHVNDTMVQVTHAIATAPVITPDSAPLGIQILIYMAMYQWFLLALILPTIYLVIVKLFGFPLLQRWSQEVVIMLYPTKAKFGKISQQYQEFFVFKEGAYWRSDPLQPYPYEEEITVQRKGKPVLTKAGTPKKKLFVSMTNNTLHIYTHGINQAAYDMDRRPTKLDELLNTNHKVRSIKTHHVWIMKDFWKHFHKHWVVVVDSKAENYQLIPVKQKQQFSLGLWHTLGISMQKEVEVEPTQAEQQQMEIENSSGSGTKLVLESVTNQTIVKQIKHIQEFHNFSANTAYRLLKHLRKVESNYVLWVSGSINPMIIVVLALAVTIAGAVIFLGHGASPAGLGPVPH